jgi:hypothetical protein
MTTYKTLTGLIKATDRLAAELGSTIIQDDREYQRFSQMVSNLHRQLNALWSNPADVTDAAKAKNRLSDAWYRASGA